MVEKTNKEIKEVKRQRCANSSVDRKAIKSVKAGSSNAPRTNTPTTQNSCEN